MENQCGEAPDYPNCDSTQFAAAAVLCKEQLCPAHCGAPVEGPLRDQGSDNEDNRLYEAGLASGTWSNVSLPVALDTTRGEGGPSMEHEKLVMAFHRPVDTTVGQATVTHDDLFLASRDETTDPWGTPTNGTLGSYINTVCNENNPHLVRDADGLRLYFDSDRDTSSWPTPSSCVANQRKLWVARLEDGTSTWTGPFQLDMPAPVIDSGTEGWAHAKRTQPFVTSPDPTEPTSAPRGRYLYWLGRESDCYDSTEALPAEACIYRAHQDVSGGDGLADAWSDVTLIARPTPVTAADFGDVGVVSDPSVTGDGRLLYFTFLRREDFPADVSPSVDANEDLLDDGSDSRLTFEWGNWRFPTGLAHPANFDDGNGDTSGWEDSVNIMADGRMLYFAYSTFLFGQGSKAGPVPQICGDPTGSCPGRAVYPRFLANEDVTRPTTPFQSTVPEKLGLSIYEATINPSTGAWEVDFSSINYATYCLAPTTDPGGCYASPYNETTNPCPNPCLTRDGIDDDLCWNDSGAQVLVDGGNPGVAQVLKTTQGAPDLSDPRCVTPEEQGMMEGAVTVSIDSGGKERMLFVRYGDLRDLTADPAEAPLSVHLPKILESVRDCNSSRQTGGGDTWCLPTAATFNNTVECIDNDPHLTAGATSVYFDSNRDAPTTPEFRCLRGIAEDFRVYHARKVNGVWSTPAQVVNGPNLLYIAWVDAQQQPIAACANCPDNDPDVCPIPCAPSADKIGKPVYNARQPAVTEDEKTMYFLGNGPYCRPETPAIPAEGQNPAVWETLEKNTGPCIYRTDRTNTTDPPEYGPVFLVVKPGSANSLPCRYDLATQTDPDIGKVIGLGEPSITKDGRLLYFLYAEKLDTGKPLNTAALDDCDENSPDPSVPGNPMCKCVEENEELSPKGCWITECNALPFGVTPDPTPGGNCKEFCQDKHVLGTAANECLPLSVFYCENPSQSQNTAASVAGVDVVGFGIGAARKDIWDPSIAVVEAAQ